MNRKQKLLVGICSSVATVGIAAGAIGIVLGKKDNVSPQQSGDYSITFDAGNGRMVDDKLANQKIYSNQELDTIPQPKVASNRSGECFAGWKDETGHYVMGKQKFTKDTKLTATYSGVVGDYCMVTFLPGPAGDAAILQGNTSVAVKSGYIFFMVNRPTATAPQKYFKQWVYAENVIGKDGKTILHSAGDPVLENHVIEADCKLKPDWTRAVSMEWDPGEGASIRRGQSTTTLESGSTFEQFNQPQLIHSQGYYFNGWYKKDGTKWKNNEPVTTNSTAIAHWREGTAEQDGFATVQFIKSPVSGDPEIYYAPTNFQVVKCANAEEATKTTTWSEVVPPTVDTADGNWEVDVETDPTSEHFGEEKWMIKVHDSATNYVPVWKDSVLEEKTIYDVYPVMVSAIKQVNIVGDSELLPEDANIKYLAPVIGGKSQDVSWQIIQSGAKINEDGTIPESSYFESGKEPATITKQKDGSGWVTVNSVDEEDWEANQLKFDIVAISTANNKVFDRKTVNIVMPYASTKNGYNKLIWFHESDGKGNKYWVSLLPGQLCTRGSSSQTYTGTYLSAGPNKEKTRNVYKNLAHTSKLYVGRAIKVIPDQFCFGWTGLNAPIDLENSNVTEIQGSFLENCTNYNQKIDVTNITSIGNHFMYNCTSFNNGSTSTVDNTFEFNDTLSSIGDDFLGKCSSFNTTIVLPTTSNITLGSSFLFGCKKFNKDLVIPSNVTSIGSFFMTMCGDFTSTLTVNTDITNFSGSIHDISVDSETYQTWDEEAGRYITTVYPIVETGFKTAGNSETFDAKYPDSHDYNSFRKHYTTPAEKTSESDWLEQATLLRQDTRSALDMQVTISTQRVYEGQIYTINNDVRLYRSGADAQTKVAFTDDDGSKTVWNELMIGTDKTTPSNGIYLQNNRKSDVGVSGDLQAYCYQEETYLEYLTAAIQEVIADTTTGAMKTGKTFAKGQEHEGEHASYTWNSTAGLWETNISMDPLFSDTPLVPKLKFTKDSTTGKQTLSAVYFYLAKGADEVGQECEYGQLAATVMFYQTKGIAANIPNLLGEVATATHSEASGVHTWTIPDADKKEFTDYKYYCYTYSLAGIGDGTKTIDGGSETETKSNVTVLSSMDTGSGWDTENWVSCDVILWKKKDGRYYAAKDRYWGFYGTTPTFKLEQFDGIEIDKDCYITIEFESRSNIKVTDFAPRLQLYFKA